jgi:hypothetical protein
VLPAERGGEEAEEAEAEEEEEEEEEEESEQGKAAGGPLRSMRGRGGCARALGAPQASGCAKVVHHLMMMCQ